MKTCDLLKPVKAFELAKGIRPNPSTIWRWTKNGSNGVKLRIEKVGKQVFTTVEWVNEFVEATTAKHNETATGFESAEAESTALTARQKKASQAVKKLANGLDL